MAGLVTVLDFCFNRIGNLRAIVAIVRHSLPSSHVGSRNGRTIVGEPPCHHFQPNSTGLHPSSDGLQLAMASNLKDEEKPLPQT